MSPNTGTGTRFEVEHNLDGDGRGWIWISDDEGDARLELSEGAAMRLCEIVIKHVRTVQFERRVRERREASTS